MQVDKHYHYLNVLVGLDLNQRMVSLSELGDSGEHATEQSNVICGAHNHGNLEKISET